eukprot:gene11962-3534_t
MLGAVMGYLDKYSVVATGEVSEMIDAESIMIVYVFFAIANHLPQYEVLRSHADEKELLADPLTVLNTVAPVSFDENAFEMRMVETSVKKNEKKTRWKLVRN